MNGSNKFETDLAGKIGHIEGSLDEMAKSSKRVLDNIEELYRRLATAETAIGCNGTDIQTIKDDLKTTKIQAGGIGGIISGTVVGLVELVKYLVGGR